MSNNYKFYARIKRIVSDEHFKNASITFIMRMLGALLLFIFNYIAVKLLGPSDSGIFFLAITIVNLVATMFLFGTDQFILRKIPSLKSLSKTRDAFVNTVQILATFSVIGTLLVILLSGTISNFYEIGQLKQVLIIMAFSIPFLNLGSFLGEVLRAKRRFKQSVFITTNSFYIVVIPLILLLSLSVEIKLIPFSYIYLFASLIYLIIAVYIFRSIFKSGSKKLLLKIHAIENYSSTLKESHPLFWISILYLAMSWVDILVVGFFLTPEQVSVYSIVSKTAKLMTFSIFAVNTIIAPQIVKLYKNNDIKGINLEAQKSTMLSVLFGLPLLIIFLSVPELILGIFGTEYLAGDNILRILALGQAMNVFTGAVIVIMTMMNLERVVNVISFCAIFTQIVLGVILTRNFGMAGMAIATLVGGAVLNMSAAIYLYKAKKVRMIPTLKMLRLIR